MPRLAILTGMLVALGTFSSVPAQQRQPTSATLAMGKSILQTYCSSCHAIAASDRSLHPDAPEFRNLSKKYRVSLLAEALAEGIMTGHPDMPVFEFEAGAIDGIIAYLESIQADQAGQ